MIRATIAAFCLVVTLAACKQEAVQDTAPVEISLDTIGHYCQMNLLEHDGPKAQVHLEGIPDPLFFSQARDAIAFARAPEQIAPILAIYVNDMGHEDARWEDPGEGNWITADDAWFVLGSNREGGMGAPETVPFSNAAAAEGFANAQGGTVMRLAQIPDSAVLAPADLSLSGEDTDADDADFNARLRALSQQQEAKP